MITSKIFLFLNILLIVFGFISSYKILCAYPTISPSHFLVVNGLLKGLADKGHNVTVITTFPSKIPVNNYRQISIADNSRVLFTKHVKGDSNLIPWYRNFPLIMETAVGGEENLLKDPNVQRMMKEETFDLVIVEPFYGNALLGLGAHFKCPTVTFAPMIPTPVMYKESGNPLALPYISHKYLDFPVPLSFKHKVLNTLLSVVDTIFINFVAHEKHRNLFKKYFPSQDYPTYDDMLKNISLNLVATHYTERNARPLVPSTIEVGGIHIVDKVEPLPEDLQKWMDDSINGVIYFSLGSNMASASLSKKLLRNIVEGFGELKQNVLWKFENKTLPFMPKNIRIQHWLPQNDILQHKNIKLFITHGGLGSVTEAKFHGVPLIITPMFADQMANAEKVVSRGWGIHIPFVEISKEKLTQSVNTILSNPGYAKNAKYESTIYRDRPSTPLETGIYWVEYVIRHNGAKHLQSNGLHLNFFELHSLDVIGFLLFVFCVGLLICYKILSSIFRKVRTKSYKIKIQ